MRLPLARETAAGLAAGDTVYLSGIIYTARDAAHRRIAELIQQGSGLPFPLKEACIYYAGPAPAPPGKIIGSAGPTTSGRMDLWTPALLRQGLVAMIGKGGRSAAVIEAIRETGAVYFGAIGGAGALLASCVKESEVIAFADLGPEAVRKLRVEAFPVTVLVDSRGTNLYETGPAAYLAFRAARQGGETQ
ncbi:MAG: Fe-S-containing hydro-lyase [Spirochaetaceae bacterium]|nr:Fe-S-containing hydro-lyase [Spirochaetaceae bacterium]